MAEDFVSGDDYDPYDPADENRSRNAFAKRVVMAQEVVVDQLRRRQEAYSRLFSGTPAGNDAHIVMEDLSRFCRGKETAFDIEERVHVLLTGRQEVWFRIMDHLRLSYDALVEKYTANKG
jgi:hypothetical protein